MERDGLSGRVIVITRPERQADGLAARLLRFGAEPLSLPAIAVMPLQDDSALKRARAEIASYDFAMFVSANAVEYALSGGLSLPVSMTVLAPGAGTAKALRARDVPEAQIVMPAACFDSEGLLMLPLLRDMRGKRVVIFRGESGREHFAEVLTERGATVTRVACYRRTLPPPPSECLRQKLGQAKLDGIVFTAGEAVENLERMLDERTLDRLKQLPAFVIHPRIGKRAAAYSWKPVIAAGGDDELIGVMNVYFRNNVNRQ
ncbi:MAG: uroporphyrinogen-III synthase [Burkholderiales bacterium]|jgi:uroporphyrinogen-III synthase|nr:uroporphyrinogen-III synthase [Burkholderiales bacterium]